MDGETDHHQRQEELDSPAVGIVYGAEEAWGRMWQQIACEGEAVHAFVIGGLNRKEALPAAEIKPVNTMTEAYTTTLTQKAGVQGPETLEGRADQAARGAGRRPNMGNGRHRSNDGVPRTHHGIQDPLPARRGRAESDTVDPPAPCSGHPAARGRLEARCEQVSSKT